MFWSYIALAVALAAPLANAKPRLLIYSATMTYRHDSIPVAIAAIQNATSDLVFDATEDRTWFTDEKLSQYDAVIFLSNSGDVLDQSGKDALQRYLNQGGNFVGLHSASDCLNTTEFFGNEVGARFDSHPAISPATIEVVDPSHPSTQHMPKRWTITEEMYNFKSDPRKVGAVVILSADESSYTDNTTRRFDHGNPHPLAWYQEKGAGVEQGKPAGRSFYTSLGHTPEIWRDEIMVKHVMGGITWALLSNTTKAYNPNGLVGTSSTAESKSPNSSERLAFTGVAVSMASILMFITMLL